MKLLQLKLMLVSMCVCRILIKITYLLTYLLSVVYSKCIVSDDARQTLLLSAGLVDGQPSQ